MQMDPSGKSKGPPPAVKKVLSMFGSGKEEDRMVGYLSFLKIGPKLLRFLPGSGLLFSTLHTACIHVQAGVVALSETFYQGRISQAVICIVLHHTTVCRQEGQGLEELADDI